MRRRVLLDEHLSPDIASVFGQRAYVHIAAEVGLAGKPDSDVIDYAIAKGCMIITNDAGLVQQYKSDPRRRTKRGLGFFWGLIYVRAETNEERKRHIAKALKEIAWQESRRHDDLIVISRDGETEHFRLCHPECAAALDKQEGRAV